MKGTITLALTIAALLTDTPIAIAQAPAAPAQNRPWMNTSLSPDERADLVVQQLTLDEKIQLAHGTGWGALIPVIPSFPATT